jgi:hypothetical protein
VGSSITCDSYYKNMILADFAFARSVKHDRIVCCKLKRTFTIVKYLECKSKIGFTKLECFIIINF